MLIYLIFLFSIFLAQSTGSLVLVEKKFTSCEKLRVSGAFLYSHEIQASLRSEEWNTSKVIALRDESDPQWQWSSDVKEVSSASITLWNCINVSHWSLDKFSNERLINFIVSNEEKTSDSPKMRPALNSGDIWLNQPWTVPAICILVLLFLGLVGIFIWKQKKNFHSWCRQQSEEDVQLQACTAVL
ncbi:hypothetical protein GJAV_G00220740 [Gymnothorax javanicus]|nr:hypothetical protein GJAV_G00220740 [Gymnothorax javanicus]